MRKFEDGAKRIVSTSIMRRAIAARDAAFDSVFVYGVLTTGVYCRPSCASSHAKPGNIRFFSRADLAEEAGLRPCKCCKPAAHDRTVELIKALARYIEAHADEPLSLHDLSRQAQLSPGYLQRTFKGVLGISPKAFHDAARLRRLKGALQAGKSVLESILEAGFQSTSRIYGHAMRNLGMTPSSYRQGGAGELISFAHRRTVLGSLVMAATSRGVCFAEFGASELELTEKLRLEFPNATLTESSMVHSQELNEWIKALEAHISGTAPRPDLPLDLRGTAFQVRVWRFLLGVPDGEVVSYGEVAQGIGAASAIRAAASACGANRIAVLIPCHRVLRANGELGGYRWGIERKRALIDAERARRAA